MKQGHVPAGMETFTAKNDRGWETIRSVIDTCDYYVLILAGRYGAIEPEWEQSWTHHEYEYAVSRGISVLAFVRERGEVRGDELDADRTKLDAFIAVVRSRHLFKSWKQKEGLAHEVAAALHAQIVEDEDAGRAPPGWYRGPVDSEFSIAPDIEARGGPEDNTAIAALAHYAEISLDGTLVDRFYAEGKLDLSVIPEHVALTLRRNMYLLLRDAGNPNHAALSRVSATRSMLPIRKFREGVWGIRPRNKGQHFALDAMVSDEISLVVLYGGSRTGKTLLAAAAGLHKTAEEGAFARVLLTSTISKGRELPTNQNAPRPWWLAGHADVLEGLLGKETGKQRDFRELEDLGYVELVPFDHLSRRDLRNYFVIVDGAEEMSLQDARTVIYAIGEASKLVLITRDRSAEAHSDEHFTGIGFVMKKVATSPNAVIINLTTRESSSLAELIFGRSE